MVFDKSWFKKYQKLLLWFANIWFGRRILCINGDKSSVGRNKITKILPHAIFWKGKKKNEYVAEVRTHNKFSKRLYYAFRTIWHLAHLWDMAWYPKLNLGFDSLTKYPDAGTGNTTVDGHCAHSNANYTTCHDATSASTPDDTAATGHAGRNSVDGGTYYVSRGIFTFDTSGLGAGATVSAATLSFYDESDDKRDADTDTLHVISVTPASNNAVVAEDYNKANYGGTSFASKAISSWNAGGAYNDFSLNASGLSNIDVSGISKFGTRLAGDINSSTPSGDNFLQCKMADTTGTSKDPKLAIVYLSKIGSYTYFM